MLLSEYSPVKNQSLAPCAPSHHIVSAQAHADLPPLQCWGSYYLAMEAGVPSPGMDVFPHPIHLAFLKQTVSKFVL